jgi:ketosteroid isomerase-like protein
MPHSDEDLQRAREEARAEAAAEFAAEQTTLQQQLQTERESRLRAEFSANVTEAIDAGRLTPAQAEGAVDFMLQLSREPMEFEFSAGEGDKASTVTKPALTWFRDFMAALPKQIDLGGERGGEDVDVAGDAEFAAPEGYAVDADSMAIHGKAVAYQKKHGCSYNEAVDAVSAGR